MSTPDPDLDRVRRAFDAAFRRMRTASTVAEQEDELSNLLQHLDKLGELCRRRLGSSGKPLSKEDFGKLLCGSDDLRAARAAMWARTFGTHETMVVVLVGDIYTDTYGEMPASWKPLTKDDPGVGRDQDYADLLKNRPVLDTTRRVFDAMAALLYQLEVSPQRRLPEPPLGVPATLLNRCGPDGPSVPEAGS